MKWDQVGQVGHGISTALPQKLSAVSDLVLHYLPVSHKKDARLKWVKFMIGCVLSMLLKMNSMTASERYYLF